MSQINIAFVLQFCFNIAFVSGTLMSREEREEKDLKLLSNLSRHRRTGCPHRNRPIIGGYGRRSLFLGTNRRLNDFSLHSCVNKVINFIYITLKMSLLKRDVQTPTVRSTQIDSIWWFIDRHKLVVIVVRHVTLN